MQDVKQQLLHILETNDWVQEDRQLMLQYLEQDDTSVLREIMNEEFARNTGNGKMLNDDKARQLLENIHHRITSTPKIARFPLWKKIASVAAVFMLLLSATYFLFMNKKEKEVAIVKTAEPKTNDVAPGSNKAVLTLADNTVIVLNDAQDGTLSQQGTTKITKLDDGRLTYSATGNTTEVLYNTVSTPRGGQYQLTLSDGTQVWLNSASSIRFPASFTGKERRVEITGEAYFEVTKNTAMPFKVNITGKGEIEVLGTHFNINSYADEATVNTTLLEGKVKVTAINSQTTVRNSQLLSPSQQAQLTDAGQISINKNIDVEKVVAWKNGKFIFADNDIQSVMRQLEKWYDIEVTYNGNVTKELFVGVISRNVNISQILTMLERTSAVSFVIRGKKIIVK